MAKKTRKVMKQESQQRAIQQAKANVSAADAVAVAPAPAAPVPVAAAHTSKFDVEGEQEFAYVKSDVRRSISLAGFFIVTMIVLSFIVH